ncbi:fimbrial protein [Serratia fonticola]|uniref:fimbrial protein n=1 Tax=Serratia fonticola TaxID=47917 RepID=UPI001378111C|nr:fimbrial protein [Serratia fonticola]NBJ36945.1 fimbrial protein [Serratia fonticola]
MKTKQASRTRLLSLSLCSIALAVLGTSQAYAICNNPPPISLTFPSLVFEGGADGPAIGQPITSGWGAVMTSPNFLTGGVDCKLSYGLTLPTLQGSIITGMSYNEDGLTYPIFSTNIPSIGIIMGIKATSATTYTPITRPVTLFYPNPSPSQGMGITVQAKLIVVGRLTSGVYPIARQNLVNVYGNGPGGATPDSNLVLNASTVTIKASTCQMVSASTQNVPLQPVSKNQFSGVNTSAGADANFSLTTLCGSGVKLYATMTDGSDPGNTGNILKPAEGTTASGIGVQILRNDQPISFGPDSAASGNTNQWYIGTAGIGGSESFTIPLKARYVQTAQTMVAGSVKARATVTFSYQ